MWQEILNHRHYKTRLIFYADILGWREHISRSEDPAHVAGLHAAVQALAMGKRPNLIENADPEVLCTSFSDHIVVSRPVEPDDLARVLESIGQMQLGLGLLGFLVRGAVTIGKIYQDKEVVFGPGLVRAYDLESKVAKFPRIVLDGEVRELRLLSHSALVEDEGVRSIDPFSIDFVRRALGNSPPSGLMNAYLATLDLKPSMALPPPVGFPVTVLISIVASHVRNQLQSTDEESTRAKLAWLLARLER